MTKSTGDYSTDTGCSTLLIMAALNEEEGIGPTLAEIKAVLNEPFCLVVDGGSHDNTVRVAESHGATVIKQKGQGKGDAIETGIIFACRSEFKYVVFIDADYTYPAEYVPKMIGILEKKPNVGMVCGNRFHRKSAFHSVPHVFYFGNRLIAFTHNVFNGISMKDPLTGLRVVRWQIVKHWRPISRSFDIEVELNRYVENRGYHIAEIPILYRKRLGEKKLKLKHGITILNRIVAESMQGARSTRATLNSSKEV